MTKKTNPFEYIKKHVQKILFNDLFGTRYLGVLLSLVNRNLRFFYFARNSSSEAILALHLFNTDFLQCFSFWSSTYAFR